MTTYRRKKGDIESLDTGLGILGVEHVGPGLMLSWRNRYSQLRYREIPRLMALREMVPESMKHLAPELFPDSVEKMIMRSPEGIAEELQLNREILAECSATFDALQGQEAIDEIARLGILDPCAGFAYTSQQVASDDSLDKGALVSPGSAPSTGDPAGSV